MKNKVKHSKRVIGAPNSNKEKTLEPNTTKEFFYYNMYIWRRYVRTCAPAGLACQHPPRRLGG